MAYRSRPCISVGQREEGDTVHRDTGRWEDAEGRRSHRRGSRKVALPSMSPIGVNCLRLAKSLLPSKREKNASNNGSLRS